MIPNFYKYCFILFVFFCLKDNQLFALDSKSEKELLSRIDILEQKIKLMQKEQELSSIKMEEYRKMQSEYDAKNNDIKFHGAENGDVQFNNNIDSDIAKNNEIIPLSDLADLYNNAVEKIRLKDYEGSSEMLKKIISVKLDSNTDNDSREIIANSHYLIGEISLRFKNYQQASSHFLSAYNNFVSVNKNNIQGANSLFQLAKSLHFMEKKDGACNSLKKINLEFPKIPENLKNKIDIEATTLHCE